MVKSNTSPPTACTRQPSRNLSQPLPTSKHKLPTEAGSEKSMTWDSPTVGKTMNVRAATGAGSGTPSGQPAKGWRYLVSPVPIVHADLEFHGYPYKIEGLPT